MRPVSFDHLRVFITICDTGSFSAAGRKLRRVQSAISQAVRTLEQTHNVVLFDRSLKRPTLTHAGQVLARQAREVLRQAAIFDNAADEIASGLESQLSISLDSCIPTRHLSRTMRALKARYPAVNVILHVESGTDTLRRMRQHSVDLGFCVLEGPTPEGMQAIKMIDIQLCPVVCADHPLAAITAPITTEMLSQHCEITWTGGGVENDISGAHGKGAWRCVDLARRLELLFAGLGWCNMPVHAVEQFVSNGTLVKLDMHCEDVSAAPLPVFAVFDFAKPPRIIAQWLLNDLQARLAETGLTLMAGGKAA